MEGPSSGTLKRIIHTRVYVSAFLGVIDYNSPRAEFHHISLTYNILIIGEHEFPSHVWKMCQGFHCTLRFNVIGIVHIVS